MADRSTDTRVTVAAVVQEMRREDITFMAASLAYHAFVSMLPILLLLTLVASVVGDAQLSASVMALTRALLPPACAQLVIDALRNASGSVGPSVVGVAGLLWKDSKIFRAMDVAFAEIYDTDGNCRRSISSVGRSWFFHLYVAVSSNPDIDAILDSAGDRQFPPDR
jgi:membrane protein